MKKLFAGLFLTASFAFTSAQTISFDKTTYDYGTVKTGADGHRMFTVKNTGDKPLIISKVQASCGCTTPEWSQEPIMPGKTAPLKVGYNTTINGTFAKIIEVYSNDPDNSRSVITIKGTVDPNAGAEASSARRVTAEAVAAPAANLAAKPTPGSAKKTVKKAKK